ncbi:MAG TPA: DHA2 family efflux MFS transporter permease subunit [Dongiaceae bacterium]|jgi:DHA2 family multidrug resistance protein|nr:DHA2 family efflux MFS transporter permease subunit [Dongiaceae bacterium]
MADASTSPAPARESHPLLISFSVMLATIMQALDTTIANVALPHMQGSLAATQDQITWVLTSYIVAAAIATPLTGFIAAKYGRKRLFLYAIAFFTLASMLCGIATSLGQMVLFRLLQGIFGAALVPLSQAILLDTYPREKHGTALAMWGIGVMVGPILGPTLGGYLTENFNWRWVFYINLPFGVLAFAGVLFYVHETLRNRKLRFDVFGFAMLGLAIGGLQMMLDRGEQKDWFGSAEIIVEAIIAGLGFYMFLVHMLTHPKPFLTPALFQDRNFVAGSSVMFVVGIILLATVALLPPYLQDLLSYPVVTTGFLLAPRGIGTMAAMIIVGRLVQRVDARYLMMAGFAFIAFSLYQMSRFGPDISNTSVVSTGVVQGIGLGFVFVPLGTVAFATLAPALRTEAAALFSLLRNIGSSIGISIVTALLSRYAQINHASLAQHVTQYRPWVWPHIWMPSTPHGAAALNAEVTRQAYFIAYNNDFLLMMWVALAAAPLLLILRKPKPGRTVAAPPVPAD